MHKPHSRLICALLALILTFSLLPLPARAVEASGQCGPDAYWRFADGVLTIYGTGPMYNWEGTIRDNPSWNDAGLHPDDGGDVDTVIIEPGITTIGDHAFSSIYFDSISIPDTVTYIGVEAFWGNRKLKSVTIPESVTKIEHDAFNTCMAMTSAVVNARITTLEADTFSACVSLSTVKLPDTLTTIGGSALASTSIRSIVIPEGVTTIEGWAFRSSPLTSITLPSTLETIGDLVFDGTNIKEIVIPENVTYIGAKIFADLNRTSPIETVTFLGDAPELDHFAFYGLSFTAYYPQDANWPESIFRNHDHINWVPYDEIVVDNKCGDDLTWTLENGVLTIIGTGAMTDFDGIAVPWAARKGEIHTVNMDSRVTHIGINAFNGCSNLVNITMPTALATIGDAAFFGCGALTSITIPDSVTHIGGSAFEGCTALTSVTLSNNLRTMGSWAFSKCSALQSITIPGTLTTIPEYAFHYCFRLTTAIIEEGVTEIGSRAFANDDVLTTLSLPHSLQIIEAGAFGACNGLTSVTIPENVTHIFGGAFHNCYNLQEITFLGDAPEMPESIRPLSYNESIANATAYYPTNRNWPDRVRHQQIYLTWVPYGEPAPDLSPLTSGWVTKIVFSAADLGVNAPDAAIQAIVYFENDGTCEIRWDLVDLTALQIYFHDMFVTAYYALAYGMGITDFNEVEQFCIDSTGMGVSDYMDTIVTYTAICNAFIPENASGTYSLNADQTAIYTDMPFMGVPSDPSIANSFVIGDNTLYLNAASYGKPDYTFVYSRIVN